VYTLPEGNMDDILTRFVLPARCVSFSPSGIHLAAGGDDDMIKMIDVQNKKVFKSIKCGGYVRGLEYDPESNFLATTCADGTFTVYEISSGKVMLSKRKGCTKVDPGSPSRVAPSWHPDGGSLVAVPCHDGSIALYERLSWDVTDELSGGHEGPVHLVQFSKNGLYLATTANDKSVAVWDMLDKTVIQNKMLPASACGMTWHPMENKLVFVLEDGTVAAWENPVPASLPGPCQDVDLAAVDGGKRNVFVGGFVFYSFQLLVFI
jgi:chromosome transmission fidelity protein 4